MGGGINAASAGEGGASHVAPALRGQGLHGLHSPGAGAPAPLHGQEPRGRERRPHPGWRCWRGLARPGGACGQPPPCPPPLGGDGGRPVAMAPAGVAGLRGGTLPPPRANRWPPCPRIGPSHPDVGYGRVMQGGLPLGVWGHGGATPPAPCREASPAEEGRDGESPECPWAPAAASRGAARDLPRPPVRRVGQASASWSAVVP